jgi:hypothetical protein
MTEMAILGVWNDHFGHLGDGLGGSVACEWGLSLPKIAGLALPRLGGKRHGLRRRHGAFFNGHRKHHDREGERR